MIWQWHQVVWVYGREGGTEGVCVCVCVCACVREFDLNGEAYPAGGRPIVLESKS